MKDKNKILEDEKNKLQKDFNTIKEQKEKFNKELNELKERLKTAPQQNVIIFYNLFSII